MDFRIAVKAVVIKDGKILLVKRRPNDVHKPGQWDVPGGRLALGEDPWTGIKRETQEEVGLQVEPILPVDVHHFTRDDGQRITMIFFMCQTLTTNVVLSEEHTEHQWITLDSEDPIIPPWLSSVLAKMKQFKLANTLSNPGTLP